MGSYVELKGIANLKKALDKELSVRNIKTAVRESTADLHTAMSKNAGETTFNKGYFTGNLKRSINMKITGNGLTGTVGPSVEYAPYLEYGTRFMAPEPFAKPSLEEVKPTFERRLKDALK